MIYLLLSIFCSASIFLIFKGFQKFKVATFGAIVVNYFIAALTGFLAIDDFPSISELLKLNWILNSVILGFFFISLFYVMAITSQKLGASVASIANKMALVIPVIFAVVYYNDSMSALKFSGILFALVGVYLSIVKPKIGKAKTNYKILIMPVILFLGSGFIDTFLKYNQEIHLAKDETNAKIFTLFIFATALILGLLVMLVVRSKRKLNLRTVIGGIVLGVVNFGSIYFLIQTFNQSSLQSSVVFPINNMGVVLTASIGSAILFKERFSKLNRIGIVLSLIAILLISVSL